MRTAPPPTLPTLPAALAALLTHAALAQCPLSYDPVPVRTASITDVGRTAAADFDGDGRTDLALIPRVASSGLVIQWGRGDGTFDPPQFLFPAGPYCLGTADFNHDGLPDLACAQPGTPQGIAVLASNGDRSFTARTVTLPHAFADLFDLTIGDFDADGHPDAAALTRGAPNSIHLARGDGDGRLFAGPFAEFNLSPGFNALNILALRTDERGHRIVVSGASPGSTIIRLHQFAGWAATPPVVDAHLLNFAHTRLAAADLDADGREDLLVTGRIPAASAGLAVLNGAQDGTLDPEHFFLTGNLTPAALTVADLDGDGDPDVATTNNTFRVWVNDGLGALSPTLIPIPPLGPQTIAAADFDRDGRLDIALTTTTANPTADVIINTGPLAFVRPILDPIFTCPGETVEVPVFITRLVNPPISWEFLSERGWRTITDGSPILNYSGETFGIARQTDTATLLLTVDTACCPSSPQAVVRCLVTSPCGTTFGPPIHLRICRPDFNCDHFLDFFDYDDFVLSYLAGNPAADFNADGFLDFFDYDDFVASFETGC